MAGLTIAAAPTDRGPQPTSSPLPWSAVTRLTVTDFRCYGRAALTADHRPVVLTGPNGAGKTNLLEAVSFLAPGRGLRRAALRDVTRTDAAPPARWAVAARIETPHGPVAIGTGLDADKIGTGAGRRVVRIDGTAAESQADLGRHVGLVWLTPQMDRLFIEGTSGRRRFLDRLVYGFHPSHAATLNAYDQVMRERSRLLKEGRGDARWLTALEDQMAGHAVAIAAARRDVVARLQAAHETAPAGDQASAFPRADLALDGSVERWLEEEPALAVEERLRAGWSGSRRIDAIAGGAADGPHRTDLTVAYRAKGIPASSGSTGEQKALLIGLVLANARLMAAERGAPPLLLLDEVAAHLDRDRRAALFEEILGLRAQAWMTGTDDALFEALGDRARWFGVRDAEVMERL